MLGVVVARDVLRAGLRLATPIGLPVLTEAAAMIGAYPRAERDLGRIAPDADTDMLALTVVGTDHLLLAGREDATPDPDAHRECGRGVRCYSSRN